MPPGRACEQGPWDQSVEKCQVNSGQELPYSLDPGEASIALYPDGHLLLKPWCCFHRAVWPLALHPWLRR